jgi:hypothetical protein
MEYRAVPANSAANSLPTAFWCPEFRCRTFRRGGTQAISIAGLFGDGEVIFGCRMRILPCQQGEIEDYDHHRREGAAMIEGGAL